MKTTRPGDDHGAGRTALLPAPRGRDRAVLVLPVRGAVDCADPRPGRSVRDPARMSVREAASLDAAVRSLLAEPDPVRIARVAAAGLAVDRVADCREPLRRAIDAVRAGEAGPGALPAFAVLCLGDIATGRWDEAVEIAEEGIALCGRRGPAAATPHLAMALQLGTALIAAARGDGASALVDPVLERAARHGLRSLVGEGHRVLSLAALGGGDAAQAYRQATAVTAPGRLTACGPAALRVSMDLVESAVQLGRWDDAGRHVQAMQDAPVRVVSARFAMLTAASAALVAAPGAAGTLFEHALAAADADRWPFDQARIQLAYGEHLRRQRRTARSRPLLVAALDTFERLGADPWATRARRGLRATGVTVGRPVGESASAQLTPDERAVAVLAATGLTNKQIARRLTVSHHTVAARLYQVFPKLGVGSRAALRGAMLAPDGAVDGAA